MYLKSAQLGVVCVIVFSFISLLLSSFLPSYINICKWEVSLKLVSFVVNLLRDIWHKDNLHEITSFSWVVLISVGSILSGYVWSLVARKILQFKAEGSSENSKILLMSRVLSDSPLDKLFFNSYINSQPLLLTLDSRKVYIGTINSLGEPTENEGMDQEISIIPLLSGYRSEDDLSISFTTYYESVNTDIELVIRQDQILSATFFDFDTYLNLNHSKKEVAIWLPT